MKKYTRSIILIVIVLLFLYLFGLFVNYYGDWLWFKNMGYSSIFDTMILSRIFSFLVFFVIFALFSTINIRSAYIRGSQNRNNEFIAEDDLRKLFFLCIKEKQLFGFGV